ncbi:MAG: DUF2974 domain-containing protein [Spirochaetaceae bacterium]|jgi:hypothetical protein|nr:DUF2974 domain-containing protein [Spirochaetaceae bacterium]
MANVFDYLDWRGDLSFRADPFNVVDNIIFSIISYYPFDGIVNAEFETGSAIYLPEAFNRLLELIKDEPGIERSFIFGGRQKSFLMRLAETPRYKDCLLCGYTNKVDFEREMQFSAIIISAPDIAPYVSFRGTDAAIIGWKEDFNMILSHSVPAQLESVIYLNKAAKHFAKKINTGGHSKGGNLAIYAAAFCNEDVQRRIDTIYSNDAPGFNKLIIESEQFKKIEDRIDCYIPEGSVVGLLFEYVKNYKVVKSSESGLLQHDPFSWEVKSKYMVHIGTVSRKSIFVNKMLMEWLENMDRQTRTIFVETLFNIVTEANIKSVPDFTDNKFKNVTLMIKSLNNIDNDSKKMLFKTFLALFEIARDNIQAVARDNIQAFMDTNEPLRGKPRGIL